MKINRALISVSDKSGIVEFARKLADLDVEIISTGGTYKLLDSNGVTVKDISEFTGFPEILDGRVKTLHPKVHGGILAIRNNSSHQEQMSQNDILPIDMVVVNLYPFEAAISKENVELSEAIENIDIGGPTMLRSAAKNNADVTVVVDPEDYDEIIKRINSDELTSEYRFGLASKVFSHTARYDSIISNYLGSLNGDFPTQINFNYLAQQSLRYGENPHQKAYFYREINQPDCAVVTNLKQIQGKELSFNNIIDIDAALNLCRDFHEDTFCVILKHTNPCGAARADSVEEAFKAAWSTDPVSAFGSIIGFTGEVDEKTAEAICRYFVEIVAAPSFTDGALEVFKKKKNLRIMQITKPLDSLPDEPDLKKVSGGLLVQDKDNYAVSPDEIKVVTKIKPTDEDLSNLMFAWKICKHIKSNAICYTDDSKLIGVGAGQMSRVDSAKIGVSKANFSIKGSFMASDAFFPFRDGIDAAAAEGVKSIIQPGGSIRDEEVIEACDEHGISMVFTGKRHFRH